MLTTQNPIILGDPMLQMFHLLLLLSMIGCPDCSLLDSRTTKLQRLWGYGDYQLGKSKKSSHQPKAEDINQEKLYLLHMDLCGPIRVRSIVGIKRLLGVTTAEDQLKFHQYKDAKFLMEAIEKRYGGNKESKKSQRTLLKQQYENFRGLSSEIIDQTFDRLQKLIGQLEVHGEVLEQEDINLKLLRSLPSEWKMLGLKDFKMILRIIAAQVYIMMLVQKTYAVGLQLSEELLLSEDKDDTKEGTDQSKFSASNAEKKTNKKNDVKARSLLLMALPNEHQLTFSQYTDAKTMFATIETRFRGNEATKKTQKTLLKQQYENFSASSIESLDSIFNRFQKIVSTASPILTLAILKVSTASFSDNVVYAFMIENPNVSNLLQQDLEQNHKDDLEALDLKWQLSLLSMRAKRYYQRIGKKIFINANDTAVYDKSKVECFNCHKMGHFDTECRAPRNKEGQFKNQDNTRKHGNNKDTSSKAMLAIDVTIRIFDQCAEVLTGVLWQKNKFRQTWL
ncbi:ribonuclease H-like domain-containing protein [Tanacetum coccineum]